jgi:glucosamine-6-phosphate deaminase
VIVPPRVFADPEDLGDAAASLVVARFRARRPGRPFLLGCPGGRSARSTYRHLARRAAADRLDLSALVVVMMDEYVEESSDGSLSRVDPAELHSCRRFGVDEIVRPVNQALAAARVPAAAGIHEENLWLPDPANPGAYDRQIADAGGIDLFLLASGAGDGHVAFNSPGAPADSRTRVVLLPVSTRRDNLVTFPSFGGDLGAVPTHGVTVGIGTIRDQSAEVVMIVHGSDKQLAGRRLSEAEHYQPDWPATVLTDCRSPHLFLDRAASSPALATPRPRRES